MALTANAYAYDVAACLDAGMQSHLTKPLALHDLHATLARWAVVPATRQRPAEPVFSSAVQERYRVRRAETLHKVDELMRSGTFEGTAVDEVAELLHKLAGTAGMFGEAELGECAGALEEALLGSRTATSADDARGLAAALRAAA